MNSSTRSVRLPRIGLILLGLALLASGAVQAQVTYKLQPILKVGDTVGNFSISPTMPGSTSSRRSSRTTRRRPTCWTRTGSSC